MRPVLLILAAALSVSAQRTTLSLDGSWQIGDSVNPEPRPASFSHKAPVPGLAHSAAAAFADVDKFDSREFIDASIREKKLPESARVENAGITRQTRNYFWYRTTFRAPAARRQSAILKVNKAQWGTAVWINGRFAGDHLGCFSAGYFDLTPGISWGAENELVIRVGAHPAVIPAWAPAGTDFEKYQWTPGIYDSVSVAFADNPIIESVQAAPRLAESAVVIETVVRNLSNQPATVRLTHAVHEWKSSVQAGRSEPAIATLAAGERRTLRATVKLPGAKLWTPETPNLYVIETSTGGDSLSTRFGMREFRFDTATKRAYLNGKLYFLRGSNVTLHRFFEDPLSKQHPWEDAWVRKLLIDYSKRMHWNSYRFCIGPAPDKWFDIADEAGLLIQNEFFIWNGRSRFPPYREQELLTQYSEWMRDNWNHPSVAIWDANNETDAPLLRDVVIPQMRKLDLSNRPWENGYTVPSGPEDPVEDHPYLFSRIYGGRDFRMIELEQMTGAKTTNAGHPSAHAVIANEYGWLWLLRDGTPTLLTERVWEKVLGARKPGATLMPSPSGKRRSQRSRPSWQGRRARWGPGSTPRKREPRPGCRWRQMREQIAR